MSDDPPMKPSMGGGDRIFASARREGVRGVYESRLGHRTVAFFVAECASHDRVYARGGLEPDGEDIEIVEIAFENAVKMVKTGEIMDAKAIMLQ